MSVRRHRLVRRAAIALLAIAITSCSIDPEGSPRDIADRDRRDLSTNFDPVAGAATGSGRIYLLSPEVLGQPRTLQSVARDVGDTPADAMRALFEGPNTTELQAMLRSAIPPGTRFLDVSLDGGVLIVNVSSELQQLTGEALIDGVAQIVLTASDITGVSGVLITIDGVRQQWPAGSGELRGEPLTRYDFPGLVLSSQPAFPSVPSPQPAPPAG
ncbi:MAG: GerMN domain-containing protein [Ilumatobacteraceae bacterium]